MYVQDIQLTSNLPNNSTAALWMTEGNKFLCLKAISHMAVPLLRLCSELQHELFLEDHPTLKASPYCCLSLVSASPALGGQSWNKTVLRTGRILVRGESGDSHCQLRVTLPGWGGWATLSHCRHRHSHGRNHCMNSMSSINFSAAFQKKLLKDQLAMHNKIGTDMSLRLEIVDNGLL